MIRPRPMNEFLPESKDTKTPPVAADQAIEAELEPLPEVPAFLSEQRPHSDWTDPFSEYGRLAAAPVKVSKK